MDRDKMDKFMAELERYSEENISKRHPIANKELAGSTDYIKSTYLKMLAMVLRQAGEVPQAQLEMFKRIIAGAEIEKTAEEYLRMALDIGIEDYVGFTEECRNLPLKYRWILDAMIMSCVQERTEEQLKLLAHFCESSRISKEEVKYIAEMAKAIVGMNETDYVTACEEKVASVPDTTFGEYSSLVLRDCIFHNDHMTVFQPSCKEDISVQALERIFELNTPCVKMIGAEITLDTIELLFHNKERVILEDCHFIGDKTPLTFRDCGELILKHCRFEHFRSRTIDLDEVKQTLVQDCEFYDCKSTEFRRSNILSDGVFHAENPSSIGKFDLIGSSFTDCGRGGILAFAGSNMLTIISNINSFVDHCSFTNCRYGDEGVEGVRSIFGSKKDGRETMFTEASRATNCSYENAALFN